MSLPNWFYQQVRRQVTDPARVQFLLEKVGPALMQRGRRANEAVRRSLSEAGLLGIRPEMPTPAPSQLPEGVRGFVGRPDPTKLRPELQEIVNTAVQRRAAQAARPPAPGVRGLSPLVQNRPPVQGPYTRTGKFVPDVTETAAPVSFNAPSQAQETYLQRTFLTPGEGEIGSFNRLRFPAGTVDVTGRKLGNVTYQPGLEAGLIQGPALPPTGGNVADLIQESLSRPRGPFPGEELGGSLFNQTEQLSEAINAARRAPRPAFGPDAGPAPVDSLVDRAFGLRNATGGVQMTDLTGMARLLAGMPMPARIAAGGVVGTGAGVGLASMFSRPDEGSAPVGEYPSTVMSPPGAPPVSPVGINSPEIMFRESDGTPLGAQSSAPGFSYQPRQQDPTAPAPVLTSGSDRDSVRRAQLSQYSPSAAAIERAMEPRNPESYKNIGEYYAAREAYASQAPVRQALMKFAGGFSFDPVQAAQLEQWAGQYPMLAYELQRRSLINPAANQQTRESVTTTTITTPMGSQTDANAVGNAESTAAAAVNPTQGNTELRSATTPQAQPQLQRAREFMEQMNRRSRMFAGY